MDLLSKSRFVRGWQCPRMVWLDIHHPELFDESIIDANLLQGGDEVGELARGVFGGKDHATIGQTFAFEEMAEETARLLAEGRTVCEATFIAEGLVSMADVFRPAGDGTWEMVEVKASTKVKPYHLVDAAFQAKVARSAGYEVSRVAIAHINGDFVCGESFSAGVPYERGYVPETTSRAPKPAMAPESFFILEDVTVKIEDILADPATDALIARLKAMADVAVEPDIACGKRCNTPHPCGYQGHCTAVPEWMLSMAGMGRAKALTALEKGIRTPEDLLAAKPTDLQRAQISSEGRRTVVRTEKLQGFLDDLEYPVYMLDFETIMDAVPSFPGTRPYQQVPTQLSLHVVHADGRLEHAEYLAPSVGDPRRGVAESLVALIPKGACTLAYNMSFEKGRLRELADAYPDLAPHLMDIHDGMRDLMVPFQKGWLYLPAMGGSYSIKRVLPALFPDDEALDYHALEDVHNGAEAIEAYRSLKDLDPEREAYIRERLLRYCELDTLAMVRVLEALRKYAVAEDIKAAC